MAANSKGLGFVLIAAGLLVLRRVADTASQAAASPTTVTAGAPPSVPASLADQLGSGQTSSSQVPSTVPAIVTGTNLYDVNGDTPTTQPVKKPKIKKPALHENKNGAKPEKPLKPLLGKIDDSSDSADEEEPTGDSSDAGSGGSGGNGLSTMGNSIDLIGDHGQSDFSK